MTARPHKPARKTGSHVTDADKLSGSDLQPEVESYPDVPSNEPGLTGGPATEAVPGSHSGDSPLGPAVISDDGGETTLPGRPRETGGQRPPKKIPKTKGS